MGADFIEPDLVSTKDGVLVARHENEISGTTDVADRPEFAARQTTKLIDGISVTGWFTEDFTLAELKTLRANERLPELRPANTALRRPLRDPDAAGGHRPRKADGEEPRRAVGPRKGRIGIYPETKHPSYFDSIGLSLEEPLVAALNKNGYRSKNAPVFIQSFEVGNLKQLAKMTTLPLIQLLDASGKPWDFTVTGDPRTYAGMASPAGLAEIATYADGIGANKSLIVPRDAGNNLLEPTTLIQDAHEEGLLVHAWTFRNENNFLPNDFRLGNPADPDYLRQHGDAKAEDTLFFGLGLDGIFTDFPDTGVEAREEWLGG